MIVYLNLTEFADRIDIARDTLAKYRLPEPDAMIGDRRGWLEATIDAWNDARPGRGNWGPKLPPVPDTGPNAPRQQVSDPMPYPEFMTAVDPGPHDQHWQ